MKKILPSNTKMMLSMRSDVIALNKRLLQELNTRFVKMAVKNGDLFIYPVDHPAADTHTITKNGNIHSKNIIQALELDTATNKYYGIALRHKSLLEDKQKCNPCYYQFELVPKSRDKQDITNSKQTLLEIIEFYAKIILRDREKITFVQHAEIIGKWRPFSPYHNRKRVTMFFDKYGKITHIHPDPTGYEHIFKLPGFHKAEAIAIIDDSKDNEIITGNANWTTRKIYVFDPDEIIKTEEQPTSMGFIE